MLFSALALFAVILIWMLWRVVLQSRTVPQRSWQRPLNRPIPRERIEPAIEAGTRVIELNGPPAHLQVLPPVGAPPADPVTPSPSNPEIDHAEMPQDSQTQGSPPYWVPKGITIDVHGLRIDGGLFYCGSGLTEASGFGIEAALVDPQLPLTFLVQTYPSAESFLRYSDLAPSARGNYLQWLAGGRQDPRAEIWMVLLYFFGLERRAFSEDGTAIADDIVDLVAEAHRLLTIYGGDEGFRRQALHFIDLNCPIPEEAPWQSPPPDVLPDGPYPAVALRRGLGTMAVAQQPIPSDWALAWVYSSDEFLPRTPATRCPEEFWQLFRLKYRREFGEGVIVKPNRITIRSKYHPASPSLPDEIRLGWTHLPDITVLKQPVTQLVALANEAQDELDAYSRLVSRRPDQAGTLAAVSLLPSQLIRALDSGVLLPIRQMIEPPLESGEFATISYNDLRLAWPQLPAKPNRGDSVKILRCLERIGYSLEPDIRFGGHPLDPQRPMVVFRHQEGPPAPSPEYTKATVFAYLGAILAHVGGDVSPAEEAHLLRHAARELSLAEPSETRRLQAYLKWLLLAPPDLSGMKKRLAALPLRSRAELGKFLASLANVDGIVTPDEVAWLGKMYRRLGIDPQSTFADLHLAASRPAAKPSAKPATEPVGMPVAGEDNAAGFRIPPPPTREPTFALDLPKVRRMQAETDQVSALLRGIFAEDEPAPASGTATVEGLDALHSQFLALLVTQSEWSRESMATVAARLGLLPDGAVDTINEMAIRRVGDLLLEGDDPITINGSVKEELTL